MYFFLKLLLISPYAEFTCTVNFKIETQIRVSDSHTYFSYSLHDFSSSFFSHSLMSRRWWKEWEGKAGANDRERPKH